MITYYAITIEAPNILCLDIVSSIWSKMERYS
jgi:hypothetical protein